MNFVFSFMALPLMNQVSLNTESHLSTPLHMLGTIHAEIPVFQPDISNSQSFQPPLLEH